MVFYCTLVRLRQQRKQFLKDPSPMGVKSISHSPLVLTVLCVSPYLHTFKQFPQVNKGEKNLPARTTAQGLLEKWTMENGPRTVGPRGGKLENYDNRVGLKRFS